MSCALPNLPLPTDQVSRKADSDGPTRLGRSPPKPAAPYGPGLSTARTPTQTMVIQPTQQKAIEKCLTRRPPRRTNRAGPTTGQPD